MYFSVRINGDFLNMNIEWCQHTSV